MKKEFNFAAVVKGLKKPKTMISLAVVCCLLIGGILICAVSGDSEETVYKETQVAYGTLAVGIEESGSIDIGTVEQVFELNMSALQRVDADSLGSSSGGGSGFSMGGMGGGGMSGSGGFSGFDQIFSMASGSSFFSSGEDSDLSISKVLVSVGQQVNVGDVLYELEEESVNALKEELESNVSLAKADLEAVYADQKLSKLTAQYTYESSRAYGDYAALEYNNSISTYEEAITDKESALAQAKATLTDLQEQLATAQANYEAALNIYNNYAWSRDNTDKSANTYLYVQYFNDAQEALSTAQQLESKVEQLENQVEQAEKNVETAQTALNKAQRELKQGILTAQQTKDLRDLAYNTAQETLDIALSYLEEEATEQEQVYAEAQEKWEEYSSHIDGINILSQYSGVVTAVGLAEGDSLNTNDVLVTLYNSEDVTMTVSVYEADMTDIALGSRARVSLIAYPEEVFEASVTEISDASTDSKGNVYYEVTVTLEGDLSGLFQSMTGEVTFISEEMKDVLYVSKRAIITENDKTYVKVKKENGQTEKRQVTTGFTDGVNIEIVEGLEEGETVLIESKVSKE